MPAYSSRGVGAVGTANAATNKNNFFAMTPQTSTGLAPGSVAIGPASMPIAAARNTLNTIGANPNLSPGILGGQQNAGVMVDRLGNQILAPGMAPPKPPGFAKGGDIDLQALLAQNTETLSDQEPEEVINNDPVGTAQKFLADLNSAGKASPTRQAIKRVKTTSGGGATADKAMQLAYEDLAKGDLGVMKDRAPAARNTESARSQMEEIARIYQMKIRSAQERSKGLSADTFGAPTLEGATLTKSKLTKKRFKDGGEAKKSDAKKTESSGFFSNLFKGSDDDFIKNIKSKAEKNEGYRAMLEYLQSRDAVPDVETGYLPYGTDAVFSTTKLPIGSGTIKINKDIVGSKYKGGIGPSTLTHEMTHAADRQLEQQASEQSGLFSKGNKFTEAYEKMVGSGGMRDGKKRTELARKISPKFVLQNEDYRATPYEIAAHGVGNYAGPTTADDAPPHVDATAATEFQILLDLARRNSGNAVKRAEGSPEEGEESLDQYYAPKARPSTGLNRKKGPISQALDSGDAYVNMAKGVTEMPYNLAGGPMDLVMLARQALTGEAPAGQVGTSDYIKRKMTELGIRQEPPADPTAKGFYTAGDLLSNLANPAGVTRAGVKTAQKTGQAVGDAAKTLEDLTVGEVQRARVRKAGRKAQDIPDTAYDPLRERLEATGNLAYAVRPTGSTMLTGPVGLTKNVSEVDQLLSSGIRNAGNVAGQNVEQERLIQDFWDKKARNYFTRQFGTPDDPIARDIAGKKIKGPSLNQMFPRYMLDQLTVGKTRVKESARPEGFVGPGTPETRFFPEYPEAMEDFTSRYDKATGLKGNLITRDPTAADPEYNNLLSSTGRAMARDSGELEADRLLRQGVRPELINPEVGTVTRSIKDPSRVIGDGTSSAKALYDAFEEASVYNKMTPEQQLAWANDQFGKGRSQLSGMAEADVGKNLLSENVLTAIQKGEPVYDISNLGKPLDKVFNPASINKYLANLNPRELANIRFEDAVRGGLKMSDKIDQLENLAARIKAGKPVADSVFSNGVSAPLLQFGKGSGFDGFAWKRIEKREATVPEGAYVGHSVGGYELGGIGYTKDKRDGFNTGRYQVYTLRDNRNRPVNTIEVKMLNEYTPVVMQIKGNGRATGNTAPEKYDGPVLRFLQDFIKPAAIEEQEDLLTPMLRNYKEELNASFKMP